MPGGVNSPVRAFRAVGGDAALHRAGRGRVPRRRRRQPLRGLRPLVGAADPRPRAPARRRRARGRASRAGRASARRPRSRSSSPSSSATRAVHRDGALRQLGHRGDDERAPAGARVHRPAKIVKFAGCYHGHADLLLVQAGSGVATLGLPDSPGVTPGRGRATRSSRRTTTSPRSSGSSTEHGGRSRRSSSSRSPATWASSRRWTGFLEGLRELTADARRAADLRRGDDRLPRPSAAARRRSTASRPT